MFLYFPESKSTPGSSIWQLTLGERNNASIFIQFTTVRPFIFGGSSFKCFYCSWYDSDITSLLTHTSLSHKVIDNGLILQKYLPKGKRTLQVDISDLKCRLCQQKYPNLDRIKEHLESAHAKQFFFAGNGMTEYNMELKNGAYICHICGTEFYSFSLLNSHINSHVGKVVCEQCGAGFLNQYILKKHKELHLERSLDCLFCDRTFSKKSQLKYHTEITHKGKDRAAPQKCNLCHEVFKEHYKKITHLKSVHGIVKTYKCHLCNTTFNTRRNLTEHTNKYHTEKYKCNICSKCFIIRSKLEQHMRGHTGERNFICPVCKKAYMHKITLHKHMRCHGSFKFVCSECGNGFHTKNEYLKHEKQMHLNQLCQLGNNNK